MHGQLEICGDDPAFHMAICLSLGIELAEVDDLNRMAGKAAGSFLKGTGTEPLGVISLFFDISAEVPE